MLTIRNAHVGDVGSLYELYMEHITPHPPKEPQDISQWRELLGELIEDPGYFLLVGETEGKIVTSVTLIIIRNLTHNLRPYSLIENVVTHGAHRHKGYASAMINQAVAIARQHTCYKVMLMTGSKDEKILRFYEQCGFNQNDKTAFIQWL